MVNSPLSPLIKTVRAGRSTRKYPRNAPPLPSDRQRSTSSEVFRAFFGPPTMQGWLATSSLFTSQRTSYFALANSADVIGANRYARLLAFFSVRGAESFPQYSDPRNIS